MGSDKARLIFEGESLLSRCARRFSAEFDSVFIACGEREREDVSLPQLRDFHGARGPISGLHAALCAIPDGDIFLVAVDMPFAEPSAAKKLIELAGDCDACVAGTEELPETLFGVYRRSVLPFVEDAIESGRHSLRAMLREIRTRYVDVGDRRYYANINTPEDYERLSSDGK